MRWITEKQRRQMELGKQIEAKAIAHFMRRFSIRTAKEVKSEDSVEKTEKT